MKYILIALLSSTLSFASIHNINSFQANFTQSVTDDKNVTLEYSGFVKAQKPQNAVWNYTKPIKKDVYINSFRVTVVEPEIEQVIIRRIQSNFDIFHMIQSAKEIEKNKYEAFYKDIKFIINTKDKLINSISYNDEFENSVKIEFTEQKQNIRINENDFAAEYPLSFDIIRD